ncbi:MAG: hypothetical protein ACM37W_28720 [Actinomycetota bacterium]
MPNLNWHDYLIFASSVACIAGLVLLSNTRETPADELEKTELILLRMTFSYWMVYCLAASTLKLSLPEWDILLMGLKATAVLSYLLTATCILSLPLHRIGVRQVE